MKKLLMLTAAAVFAAAGVVGCGEKNTVASNDDSPFREDLEQVKSMVNEMLDEDDSITNGARCQKIRIRKKADDGRYFADAILDNGDTLKINFKLEDDTISVKINDSEQLKSMVNEILQREFGKDSAKCLRVRIKERIDKYHFRAVATLDNGNDIVIMVERRGDMIEVSIPEQ